MGAEPRATGLLVVDLVLEVDDARHRAPTPPRRPAGPVDQPGEAGVAGRHVLGPADGLARRACARRTGPSGGSPPATPRPRWSSPAGRSRSCAADHRAPHGRRRRHAGAPGRAPRAARRRRQLAAPAPSGPGAARGGRAPWRRRRRAAARRRPRRGATTGRRRSSSGPRAPPWTARVRVLSAESRARYDGVGGDEVALGRDVRLDEARHPVAEQVRAPARRRARRDARRARSGGRCRGPARRPGAPGRRGAPGPARTRTAGRGRARSARRSPPRAPTPSAASSVEQLAAASRHAVGDATDPAVVRATCR